MDDRTRIFQQQRQRLYGMAYRMLGARADAEDMVQEAYLRWHRTDITGVESPEAWLTTTITRLCIDRMRKMRGEREAYFGPWLPEPMVGDATPAERQAELASDLSMAFLVVLERLAPQERAAFLLHDVFDCDYGDIAHILERNEPHCRQMVHRARERVRREKPRFTVSEQAHRRLLKRFLDAVRAADHDALLALFAEDATWTADGGGKAPAASRVVAGRERVAKLLAGVGRVLLQPQLHAFEFRLAPVNGETGIIAYRSGQPVWVLALQTDGRRIHAGYNVINPEKLSSVRSLQVSQRREGIRLS